MRSSLYATHPNLHTPHHTPHPPGNTTALYLLLQWSGLCKSHNLCEEDNSPSTVQPQPPPQPPASHFILHTIGQKQLSLVAHQDLAQQGLVLHQQFTEQLSHQLQGHLHMVRDVHSTGQHNGQRGLGTPAETLRTSPSLPMAWYPLLAWAPPP